MKKIYLALIFGIFLLSVTSAININVTLPVPQVENISSTLQEGGSLDADTTYYYVVVAYSNDLNGMPTMYANYFSPSGTVVNFFSPLSKEMNFTTNSTHKSALINWDSVSVTTDSGLVYYQILLTKVSGDYTSSGGYGTGYETVGSITNNYYTVSSANSGTYAIHTANLKNTLPYNLNKSTGIIKINIEDGTLGSSGLYGFRYPFEAIYQAIVSAGYEDYVYWDGVHFALKGWITFEGSAVTNFYTYYVDMTFVKGGISIENPNAFVRFGYWINDDRGADYNAGVTMTFLNSRSPLKARYEGTLEIFGSHIQAGLQYYSQSVYEMLNTGYFIGSNGLCLTYAVDGIKDSIVNIPYRATTTEFSDMKISISNNWGTSPTFRNKIINNGASCYASLCMIYDTEWTGDLTTYYYYGFRMYIPATGAVYRTYLYDPVLTQYYDSNNNVIPTVYFMTNYGVLANDAHLLVFNTVHADVLDEDGNPLSDVKVYLTDKEGNAGYWVEHDNTRDRRVTGNYYNSTEYELNVSTNENGTIDYYVRSYKVGINQSNTIASTYCDNDNYTFYYPYTITFEKPGYKNYTVQLNTLTKKTNLLVTLEEKSVWDYAKKVVYAIMDFFNTNSSLLKVDEDGNLGIKGVLVENTNVSAYDLIYKFNDKSGLTDSGDLIIEGNLSEGING